MKEKKIIKKIHLLERQYKKLKEELEKHPLIKSKKDEYAEQDKYSFLLLWKKYVKFYLQARRTILFIHYRNLFLFPNFNKIVLKRHLTTFYYNTLVETIELFWIHETFIRQLLQDHFFFDFEKVSRFIYRPSNIQIINIPNIIIISVERQLKPETKKFLNENPLILNHSDKRFSTDSSNIYFYIRRKTLPQLFQIAKYIGDTIKPIKFTKRKTWLIKKELITTYLQIAQPWDILLVRANRHATNLSVPWFWKHMALFLGSWEFLQEKFEGKYPFEKWKYYIIEATGDGVGIKEMYDFTTQYDYLWVVRTTFSHEKILRSIQTALSMLGKPYDYLFNFYSDKGVVCSELILKSFWKQSQNDESIQINLTQIGFSITFPPQKFIKLLTDEQKKKNPTIKPFFFIDAKENWNQSFIAPKEDLLKTRFRPTYSFLLK